MRIRHLPLTLLLALALTWGASDSLSAQGPPPSQANAPGRLVVGLSAGAGAVDNKRLFDAWKFGPVFGGRVAWAKRTWAAAVRFDVQPFRAERTDRIGDFRAMYVLPTYSAGSPTRRLGLSLGFGVFDLRDESGAETREVGFVPGLSGSFGVTRTLSVELAWRRVNNIAGLKGSFYTVQLVQSFGF